MTTNLKNVTASKTELEQAQASLHQSEQRWATTLSSIGDSVIATNVNGSCDIHEQGGGEIDWLDPIEKL